ncbi:LCP family protein [Kitasatospora sp. CB02891]|uniref:LCP family protein n=1 Tax=Kitasatospora sp. CB02891 TaxID=2020329 RepID=UPI000C277152|nr:LCP family protein [Kitasatospora sp. CB02891]PJN24656.1 transcriptional regulator [Kitasatospora sp. CB02891]
MTAEERPDEADEDQRPLSIFDRDDDRDDDRDGDLSSEAETAPRRRRGRRLLLWTLAVLLVLFGAGFGALVWTADHYASSVARIPNAFPTGGAGQPTAVPHSGQTFLLVGLDARADRPTTGQAAKAPAWQLGAQRSDTMMLMHISADRKSVSVVSIPRDTWVSVPGHGKAKINAAYSWGGPALMVQTVQDLTRIRIDHLAVIDWNGFRALTDAVGGVDITVPRTIEAKGDAREWLAGTHHMDGAEALLYVRERHGLPNGDLDRTKRQQNFLRALMLRTMNSGTLSSPAKLTGLLGTVGDVVSVDDRLSNSDLYDLAWSLRAVRPDGVHFMNAPFGGFDSVDGQSVVLMDDGAAGVLWDAMRTDRMDDYLTQHRTSADTLGDNVD